MYGVDRSPVPVNTKPKRGPLGKSQHLQIRRDGGGGGTQKGTEGERCQVEGVRQDYKDGEEAPDCGRCSSCLGEGPKATRAQSRGTGALTQEPCEAEQRRCGSWPEPPPPPPASWGASSIDSEATPENLASGSEELTGQQAKMMEATTKLLAEVS